MADACYITTETLAGLEIEVENTESNQRVDIIELSQNVRDWLDGKQWTHEVELSL